MKLPFRFPPSSTNAWCGLDESNRKLWLKAARDRFFGHNDFKPSREQGRVVVIDGSSTDTLLGFYCAIGEAVNGPGGYFGSTMQAFDDCLFGGFGLEYPYTIVWRNHEVARVRLGSHALLKFLDDECESEELYQESFAEGFAWVRKTRQAALKGEGTLFDEIAAIICREHDRGPAVLVLE